MTFTFVSEIHEIVSHPLLNTFRTLHSFVISYPHSTEDEEKTQSVWLKGHTGTLALNFN